MIEVRMYPDTTGGVGDRGRAYIAECEVDGVQYAARSHFGASLALARILVAAGVLDQPMCVRQDGLAGFLMWPSLHKAAGLTISESATAPIRLRKWEDPSLRFGKLGGTGGGKQGVDGLDGTLEPSGPSCAVAAPTAAE